MTIEKINEFVADYQAFMNNPVEREMYEIHRVKAHQRMAAESLLISGKRQQHIAYVSDANQDVVRRLTLDSLAHFVAEVRIIQARCGIPEDAFTIFQDGENMIAEYYAERPLLPVEQDKLMAWFRDNPLDEDEIARQQAIRQRQARQQAHMHDLFDRALNIVGEEGQPIRFRLPDVQEPPVQMWVGPYADGANGIGAP